MTVTASAQEDEADLIAAAKQGDRQALGRLFEQHRERIQRFLQKRVTNKADVDDLIQTVFLEMARGFSAYEGRSRFSTWVLGISLNLVRNHYARAPQFSHQFVTDEATHALVAPATDCPETSVACDQTFATLDCAIAALPNSLRDPLVLVVYQGLSYEEAAACMGISLSSLKSRIFRARKLLYQSLGE